MVQPVGPHTRKRLAPREPWQGKEPVGILVFGPRGVRTIQFWRVLTVTSQNEQRVIINYDTTDYYVYRKQGNRTQVLRSDGEWETIVEGQQYLPTAKRAPKAVTRLNQQRRF